MALIFAPTRELASQIKEQCDLYGLPRGIKTCTIVGGTPSRQQREWLEDKNDIVVVWLTLWEKPCFKDDSVVGRFFPFFSFVGC